MFWTSLKAKSKLLANTE